MSESIKAQVEKITGQKNTGWANNVIAWIVTIAILVVMIPFVPIIGIVIWIHQARQSRIEEVKKSLNQVDFRLQEIQHMLDDDEAEVQGKEILAGFLKEQNESGSPSES